jgi:hypothetical protein
MICFGHYGFRKDVKASLKRAREQLSLWVEIVQNQLEKGDYYPSQKYSQP